MLALWPSRTPPFLYFLKIAAINLNARGGSRALVIASVWTGTMHMVLALLGTFILKRFPTSFSIGFLLGILLVLANQNLILFGTFSNYDYGSQGMNQAFGALAFALFAVLAIFAALLFHFSKSIIVAPVDAKGFGRRGGKEEAFQQNDSTDNENSQA